MSKFEFVEYTGRYPNLCSGRLFIRIDGKLVSFGDYCLGEKGKTSDEGVPNYPEFWVSGGSCWIDKEGNEGGTEAEWKMAINEWDKDKFPPEIKELLQEILELFNENVPWGCCNGCL